MPANLSPEFLKARQKYQNSKSLEEKLNYTKEMISTVPKHKGAEKLRKNLRRRLKKLKEKKEKQVKAGGSGYSFSVPKQGFQICIMGYPNTGKSTVLEKLTNADPEIAGYPYTTKEPEVGTLEHGGAKIQLVDLPPLTKEHSEDEGKIISVALNSDGLILMAKDDSEAEEIKKKINVFGYNKPIMVRGERDVPTKKEIFNFFDLIRVYTKEPGEKPDKSNPLLLKKGSTVKEVGERIHKDFSQKLRYAKVWGSSKFPGQKVEKEHVLEDEDVVEFHV